ncbi:ciliogenesis-associated TTC17-interacting protein isoform X1 [Dasypus novemcinctus]|uniref:ciliogenesis-associated TTC17-interacting protein isoform X1 n=1 Tax=Dasypus novemcinctus TaxID=9361 RepID=UPI000C83C2EB|nr:ciliogenesis-associated TTC17-interacting protein isoform X1 [Dasypus novemcinctus]
MSSKIQSAGQNAKDQRQSLAQESLPPPEANAEAVRYLNSLLQEELQLLFFSETLAMVSDTGEPQGELTIDIQKRKYKDEPYVITPCFLVHAFSHSSLDKTLCGNSLLGYLSGKMEVMEQHSHEFIQSLVLPTDRKTTLLRQDDQLAMTRSVTEGEEAKTEVTHFPAKSVAGFISEAANLVLLRVMARRRAVPGDARFLALDTEGKLCFSTYQALGFQKMQVDHHQVEVFIVEQTVHSIEGIPMSCLYYLFSDGHLAKRVQVGSPGFCIVTKMPILREEDEMEPRPVFEKKPLVWEEDLELYSRFLDRKVRRGCSRPGRRAPPWPRPTRTPLGAGRLPRPRAVLGARASRRAQLRASGPRQEELRLSHTSYLRHHPEARALVSDFLLFLLLRQPADVVTFAAEYFGPFAVHRPPTPALRSSHRPSPFRSLGPERRDLPGPWPASEEG